VVLLAALAYGDEPIALRVENFTVPPIGGPVMLVRVQNRGEKEFHGELRVKLPDGWKLTKDAQAVTLSPGEQKRLPFAVERAAGGPTNSYPVQVVLKGGEGEIVARQQVVCASAPFYKPEIDGDSRDWAEAIPVAFDCRGKKTTIKTHWNREAFCLLVEVEEDRLVKHQKQPGPEGFDAVQVALAAEGTVTPTDPSAQAERYEFLLAADTFRDKCFQLLKPGQSVGLAVQERPLASLATDAPKLAVKRKGTTTFYECALPFAEMPDIQPTEGREFRFSVLVHDPDGTGVRDLGAAVGLWPWQRSRLAWCSWKGVCWRDYVPFDGKIEWGLCSSRR